MKTEALVAMGRPEGHVVISFCDSEGVFSHSVYIPVRFGDAVHMAVLRQGDSTASDERIFFRCCLGDGQIGFERGMSGRVVCRKESGFVLLDIEQDVLRGEERVELNGVLRASIMLCNKMHIGVECDGESFGTHLSILKMGPA